MANSAITTTTDVVVVGGGLVGCASAWALTQAGITDVKGVERHTLGSGGTGKSSGVVRCHYGVSSILAHGGRVAGVRLTDDSTISAKTVVVAAGPWSVALLASHGIDLPMAVPREQVLLIDPGEDLGRAPCSPIWSRCRPHPP